MSLQQTGIIHKIFDQEQITDTFKKREFVLSVTSANYTEYIKFEMVQDRCDMLANYKEGDTITVYFDLRGREWQGKYFVNLRSWKLSKGEGSQTGIVKVAEVPEKKDGDDLPLPF